MEAEGRLIRRDKPLVVSEGTSLLLGGRGMGSQLICNFSDSNDLTSEATNHHVIPATLLSGNPFYH